MMALPETTSLYGMFSAVARRTPDAIALIARERRVTYGELDRCATALARRLCALGVGPEIPVGVRLDRSIDLVVAMLAVLEVGGVYLPVELGTPAHRCQVMLTSGAVRVLITRSDVRDPVVTGPIPAIVYTDVADSSGEGDLDFDVHGDNLAYITFTSGSSGTPKAVGTTHRNAFYYLRHLAEAGYLTAADTTLQLAAPSFDAWIRDVLGPLTVGARVVLVPDELVRDPDTLHDLLVRHAVTVLPALVPATLRLLCDTHRTPVGLRLRRLMVSGETLTLETVHCARDRLGADIAVVNHYGPTECTMTSTFHLVDPAGTDPIPVGRQPSWGRTYLLDDTLSPVPPGTIGEIYLGSAGVTRGYVNQPASTAIRFLPDPFTGSGDRMYRTGDLGRLRPDGELEFHGRVDAQLNVNGVRIEPEEIEATLRRHESVAEVAVAAVPGARGGHVLVGYVVARAGRVTDAGQLRRFAHDRLPEALVPKAFIPLPELPRNSRGKLDRAALAAHRGATPVAADRLPRTEDEAIMLTVWRDLLRRPDLSPHENLFEAGADSILAMSLLARIRRAFGRAPSLADIFRAPTVAAATRMLPPQQDGQTTEPGPVPAGIGDRCISRMPLSFAQQRLWFFERLLTDTPLNTIAAGFRVDGALDADALAAATRDVLIHHEALRSTFQVNRGQPTYEVTSDPTDGFDIVPTAGELHDRITALAREPMDIERGPLLRITLFRGADGGALLVRVHHLVADAGSMEILFDDLAAAYHARSAGAVPRLPPNRHSYADFVTWQHDWLNGEGAARQFEFWRDELNGAPPLLELPTDRIRPPVQRHQGAVHLRGVPPHSLAAATALGRAERATPFMVLLTAWAALLARYSGREDLVVGVPVTGRSQPELDRVIGLFVNTLPVRISLNAAPTFRQLLSRVRDALLQAIAHRDYPFERLVEQLRPDRSTAYGPVFQTLADIQRAPSLVLTGVRLTPVTVDTGTARFDLSLSFLHHDSELVGAYTFNTDLFEAATVERMAVHFETLLSDALAAPDRPVSALAMLDKSQRRALTTAPKGSTAARHPNVVERIADQIRQRPDRIAVTCAGRHLSYAELDAESGRIAGQLVAEGIGPGALVGICAERSLELVAGLVGVQRTGAAYLPLDPTQPTDRLAALVADARPGLVLAPPHLLARLGPQMPADVPLRRLDKDAVVAPWARTHPDDLAYVIYTSGSTGVPKGVEVTHAGLAHLLGELATRLSVTPDDTMVAITTVSFDISALEFFLPLMTGARVVVAGADLAGNPEQLAVLVRAEGATLLQATPTVWQLLTELGPAPHSLRIAMCGGEALPPSLAAELRRMAGRAYNVYGPTETTIWSTIAELDDGAEKVLIGRPIGDTAVLVLDDRLQPVPAGVAGEIYLGGPGVSRGYRNQPGLTAARFLPDPFATTPGARMYRTGDRGRRHLDNRLEYLGRVDRQIKLRGYRIEPAEVERALLAYPSVRRAVVTVCPDAGGRPQLVAYLVVDARLDTDLLRAHLTERLPSYLVPAAIVPVDALPLTSNGKIDIARLPSPDSARPLMSTEYRPPRTDTERVLGEIWTEVLGVDDLGVDDDFFDLGGHSLRAIQVMSQVNEAFGLSLELYVLFSERTLRRLAARVEQELALDRQ
ncbi:amino acid adenylation domain-containing protein [Nocardia abscessus]|uniref:non-ribosomal peptide synthetase n=1 Tax=Nocardia abscessus TaxID=120957 RepID=UPI0018932877|nr:non-ribosomal peptide synthetase [Nocardia abscessus]MBF6221743.1 amino acid adenylation domain-containing protein [Nocardia abscessus]